MTSKELEEETASEAITLANTCINSILNLTTESPAFDPGIPQNDNLR